MTTFGGVQMTASEDMPDDYGRWLIHGPQGSGKTTVASTIAEVGKVLFIDLTGEKGIRSFKGAPHSENITILRPQSITALDDIFWELNSGKHEFKAVILDSLTALQKMTMRYLLGHDETAVREIKKGGSPADMRTWGQSLDIMTDTATFWMGLADADRDTPMHVVMTAQSKMMEDHDGNMNFVPDVQRGAISITLASADYIVYTDIVDNLEHLSDPEEPEVHHILRFGANTRYRTKGRVPYKLRGKMPTEIGRTTPPNLTSLSRVLQIGGVPAKTGKASSGTEKKGK